MAVLEPSFVFDSNELIASGKNSKIIDCLLCKTKILRPGTSAHLHEKILLVLDKKDGEEREEADWWLINDIWDFDNISFTKADPSGKKYLTCGACERGILGFQHGGRILLAHTRIHYL